MDEQDRVIWFGGESQLGNGSTKLSKPSSSGMVESIRVHDEADKP